MKKHIIAFLILLIAAGGSVGVFLKVRDKKDKEEKKQAEEIADLYLFNFNSDTIDTITINNPDSNYTVKRQDKKWILEDGDDFVVDHDYMTLICTYFSNLTAVDVHSGDPVTYGLDKENASTITMSGGGQSYTVHVGGVSPTQEHYFISVGDSPKIYSIDSVFGSGSRFSTDKLMLKSKNLINYGDNDFRQITFYKDDKVVCDLKYDEKTEAWSLPEEYDIFQLDRTAITSMINVMTRLQAQQMLEENLEDLSKYGFDDPYAKVVVKAHDGTERHIIAGDFSEDKNYMYFLVYNGDKPEETQVQTYFRADVDFIDSLPINFISTTVYNPTMYDLKSFNVEYDGQKYEFSFDHDQKKCFYNDQTIQMGVPTVLTALTNYYNSFSIYTIKQLDTKSKPELKAPLFTAEYEKADGTKTVYQLADAGNKMCYVFVDGEYTGEIISDSCLIGSSSADNYFGILKTVANID